MCFDTTINVEGLGKCYQIYRKPHDRLLQSLFRGKKTFYKDFWALRNISFNVGRGETVGIVGRNGSGKTTLLQLICGTLLPTEGACEIHGRVAALLALGAGFHPEYTGAENIQLYASLLGLERAQIDAQYDSICEFADIGEFISQPVKQYSSGMYMRLAFAIAVHSSPDILIVDEALAVGDEAFQRKCFAKLEELKNNGMTLLFVSHSASSVVNLCDRALLLDQGRLLLSGKPKSVIAAYHKLLFTPNAKLDKLIQEIQLDAVSDDNQNTQNHSEPKQDDSKTRAYFLEDMQPKSTVYYEENGARISNPRIETLEGRQVNMLCTGERYNYTYSVKFLQDCNRVRFGMMMKTVAGIEVSGYASSSLQDPIESVANGAHYEVTFVFVCRLNPGIYFLNAGSKAVSESQEIYLHRIIDALMIRVLPEENQKSTGIVDLQAEINVREIVEGLSHVKTR